MPKHLIEDYDSDISNSASEDDQELVHPEEQSIFSQVQIKLTTPKKTEYNLLSGPIITQSAPTSPILKKRQIPISVTPNSSEGEESGVNSTAVMRQRSRSVEGLADLNSEDEKQTNSDYPPRNNPKGSAFSRLTGIANRFKPKNKFFGNSVMPSVPQVSEASTKPSAVSSFKSTAVKTVTSLKDKTQKKMKSKTTMISI